MAFGKVTKEELVAAGLDPDEIKTALAAGMTKAEFKESQDAFKTDIMSGIKTMFSDLETRMTTPRVENNDDNNGNGDNKRTKTPDMFEEMNADPTSFALEPGTHIKKLAGALVNNNNVAVMGIRRDNAYERAANAMRGFKNETLCAEIDAEWAKYTPAVLVQLNSDPNIVIKSIHDKVIGAHIDEIRRDEDKKDGKFNLIQNGGSNRVVDTGRDDNQDTRTAEQILSPEEKKAAENFGMTPQEYLDSKKAMKYVQ